eukprot:CAMPEP_0167821158 /NCGR_PEP_ID=MMETSP0112_2-20121227/6603_1 /TAXON_ID=91324 /ORGANISM="Lotharella globosa, Strain CCCM811" /LENGTH=87 /DNA_ID=CAMNT_0007722019 /DNA_START=108 /DNA_END=367 /DNA_ORIENTATION=-
MNLDQSVLVNAWTTPANSLPRCSFLSVDEVADDAFVDCRGAEDVVPTLVAALTGLLLRVSALTVLLLFVDDVVSCCAHYMMCENDGT